MNLKTMIAVGCLAATCASAAHAQNEGPIEEVVVVAHPLSGEGLAQASEAGGLEDFSDPDVSLYRRRLRDLLRLPRALGRHHVRHAGAHGLCSRPALDRGRDRRVPDPRCLQTRGIGALGPWIS